MAKKGTALPCHQGTPAATSASWWKTPEMTNVRSKTVYLASRVPCRNLNASKNRNDEKNEQESE
ncbi:MAG: hypothetical protein L6R42_004997 [Xanthoria sp. 1 TBL-2021]|nr:MAG: hypothetical protein L6R42_004997 [Xanthoria sp. 1 TBL-2021]